MQGNNINPNGTAAALAAPASQHQGRAGLSPAFMKPYTRRKVTVRRVSSPPSADSGTAHMGWLRKPQEWKRLREQESWPLKGVDVQSCFSPLSSAAFCSVFSQHSSGYPLSMFVGACSDISKHRFGEITALHP